MLSVVYHLSFINPLVIVLLSMLLRSNSAFVFLKNDDSQKQQRVFERPSSLLPPFTDPWVYSLQQFYNTFGYQRSQEQFKDEQQCAYSLPDFDCEPFDSDDGLLVRDAYHLRPQDISTIIALGDSITAGFGMLSSRPPFASVLEYRGKVFSIGGDEDEEYTLPHFLSHYTAVAGSPHGVTLPLSRGKALNNAVSGAKVQDLDQQVTRLVHQLKHHPYTTSKDDWKLITLFVGANNVCVLCTPPITRLPSTADVDVFEKHIRSTLERLRLEVGKSFVNLVALFNVSSVYEASRGNPYCELVLDPSHMVICSCLQANEEQRRAADLVVHEYNERLASIAQDYQMLHDPDFAVSYQPGFKFFPVGKYKQRYLSGIDCFHPNRCANQVMSLVLWNNMFSNQEEKETPYHVHNLTFVCPDAHRPYLQ